VSRWYEILAALAAVALPLLLAWWLLGCDQAGSKRPSRRRTRRLPPR